MKKNKTLKGMSFLEAIIALFIFVIVIVSVTQMFTGSFGGYRKADLMQKNIESVQYAINTMAKSLRTSSVYPIDSKNIVAYDHSGNGCRKFSFDDANGKILVYLNNDNGDTCRSGSSFGDSPQALVSQFGLGRFLAVGSNGSSNPRTMGKVTISFKACSQQDCAGEANDAVVLQTSVSLRDYDTVGL